jgi:DNA-directed RNA polymerase subunit M/transcription elongation factor TFIIS
MTRLEARLSQAGMRKRCPVCFWQFNVPTAEEVAAAAERSRCVYELSQGSEQAVPGSAAFQTYVAVTCRICRTRMYATPDEVGRELTCPDCGAATTVAPPSAEPAAPAARAAPAVAAEEYALYQGEGQPPPDRRDVHQTYIPVVCGVCHTRMLATLDQVGQKMICPDCNTPSVVPPPAPRPSSGPVISQSPDEQYAIGQWNWWETAQPGPRPSSEILATCPLCHTRLYASLEQVGHNIACPDCGREFAVPAPSSPPSKPNPLDEIGEEYRVAAPSVVAQRKPAVYPDTEPTEAEREVRSEAAPSLDEVEGEVPRWPFLSGVFSFPFYSESLVCWGMLSAGALLTAALAYEAFVLAGSGPLGAVMSMILGSVAAVVGAAWLVAASAAGLAILQDTSEGCDRVVNWPQGQLLDWFTEFLFVFNSAVLAMVLGLGLRALFELEPRRGAAVVGTVFYAFFPLFLVSMLEAGSPLRPFSAPIWRSVLTVCWGWIAFYVETALIVLLVVLPAILLTLAIGPLAGVPAIVLAVAALMVYFRLLGRLVWYCAQRLPDKEETDGKEEAAP